MGAQNVLRAPPIHLFIERFFVFLVLLNYVRPLSEVDQWVPAHKAYLEQQYKAGHFLLSGRKEPRTGGVILATGLDKAGLETVIAQDPFKQAGVAEYQVIEWVPSMSADRLAHLLS